MSNAATALAWGVGESRRNAKLEPRAASLRETKPRPTAQGSGIAAWIEREHRSDHHPAGTRAIGGDPAQGAVVDAASLVDGLPGLLVADASPRACRS